MRPRPPCLQPSSRLPPPPSSPVPTCACSTRLLPTVAEDFAVPATTASIVVTAFTLAYGLFQIVHGPLGDRVGKLRSVGGATLIASAASLGCAFAPSLPALAAMRFATGIGAAAIVPLHSPGSATTLLRKTPGHARPFPEFHPDGADPWARHRWCVGRVRKLAPSIRRHGGRVPGGEHRAVHGRPPSRALRLPRLRTSPETCGATMPRSCGDRMGPHRDLDCISGRCPVLRRVRVYGGAYLKERFDLSYLFIGGLLAGFGFGGVIYSLMVRWLLARLGEKGFVRLGGALMFICMVVLPLLPLWQATAFQSSSSQDSASTCFTTRCRREPRKWRRKRAAPRSQSSLSACSWDRRAALPLAASPFVSCITDGHLRLPVAVWCYWDIGLP